MTIGAVAGADYVDASTTTAGGGTVSVTQPTNVTNGEVVVLIATAWRDANTAATISIPAGFTIVSGDTTFAGDNGSNGYIRCIAYRVAGASEPATYDVTYGVTTGQMRSRRVTVLACSGYVAVDNVASSSVFFDSSFSFPNVSASQDCATLCIGAHGITNTITGAPTLDGDYTLIAQEFSPASSTSTHHLIVADQVANTGTLTGATATGMATVGRWGVGVSIALVPGVGGQIAVSTTNTLQAPADIDFHGAVAGYPPTPPAESIFQDALYTPINGDYYAVRIDSGLANATMTAAGVISADTFGSGTRWVLNSTSGQGVDGTWYGPGTFQIQQTGSLSIDSVSVAPSVQSIDLATIPNTILGIESVTVAPEVAQPGLSPNPVATLEIQAVSVLPSVSGALLETSPVVIGDIPNRAAVLDAGLYFEVFPYFSGAGLSFSLVSGVLPPGLSLSVDGAITGTPTAIGAESGLVIRATNLSGFSDSNAFTITVFEPADSDGQSSTTISIGIGL